VNEKSQQRPGEPGPRKGGKRRNASRKRAENARSRRKAARQERSELYLRWREESFDTESGRFIGDFRDFQDFYEVWATLDNAEDLEHEATGKPSSANDRQQSPLGIGDPKTETNVPVLDASAARRPFQMVAVSVDSTSSDGEISEPRKRRKSSCVVVFFTTLLNCLLIVAVITTLVMLWNLKK